MNKIKPEGFRFEGFLERAAALQVVKESLIERGEKGSWVGTGGTGVTGDWEEAAGWLPARLLAFLLDLKTYPRAGIVGHPAGPKRMSK